MRPHDPRHTYVALLQQRRVPETALERTLYVHLHGVDALNKVTPLKKFDPQVEELDPSVRYPLTIFNDPTLRAILEAFLIATEDDYLVHQATAMPTDEVGAYRTLFFDSAVFRTDLELIQFLKRIPDDNPDKNYYRIAFHQGVDALRWHFCRSKGSISAEDVVHTVMTDSFFRSIEHRGQPITSKQARESAKYAKLAMECGKLILTSEADPGTKDVDSLRIKFEEVRANRKITDIQTENNPNQVMH